MAKRGDKTREQLIKELAEVRSQIIDLKAAETGHKKVEKALRASAVEGIVSVSTPKRVITAR